MSSKPPSLESVFSAAIEKNPKEAMLAHAAELCGVDSDLLAQAQRLIEAHCRAATSFLESPATGVNQFEQTMDVKPSVLESLREKLGSELSITLKEDPGDQSRAERPSSTEIPNTAGDARYQIHGEIAQGGMGAVLKGRDVDLGRNLAIKVLLDRHKNKNDHIARFVEEAQIGGQLQHPGIVPIYELGQFGDQRPFFTMKLVKGETLAATLARRKSPDDDLPKLVGIFEQICQTMAYAHSKGVIHRDLKPANIMVGAFGEVQVMDWGLSKVLQSGGVADEKNSMDCEKSFVETRRSTGSSGSSGSSGSAGSGSGSDTIDGSIMGTPAYMPPEQAHGETDRLDTRTDVFGLGAILAEVLTGSPAYIARSNNEALRLARRAKLDECYKRVASSAADSELKAICKQALAVEQIDRHHDASELSAEITAYLEGVQKKLKATELARVAAETRSVEESKRKRLYLGIAGLVCIALVASVFVAFRLKQAKDRARLAEKDAKNSLLVSEQEKARSDVQRITSDAVVLMKEDRSKSILLLTEAIEIARSKGVWPVAMTHAALLKSTMDLSGKPQPDRQQQLMSHSGDRMVVWEPGKRQIQILDVSDNLNTVLNTLTIEQGIESVTIDAAANRIAARTRNRIVLWALGEDGKSVQDRRDFEVVSLGIELSRDGELLTAATSEGTYVWNGVWNEMPSLDIARRLGSSTKAQFTISNDNRWLASHELGKLRLWDLDAEDPETSFQIPSQYNCFASISRDSRWLVAGAVGMETRVYDLTSDDISSTEQKLPVRGWAIDFSRDRSRLAIWESGLGILLFDLEPTGPKLSTVLQSPEDKLVGDIEFSPDSQWLAVGANRDLRLWNVNDADLSGKPQLLSSDGQSAPLWIASDYDENIRMFAAAQDDFSRSIQFSTSGQWLVTRALRTSRILDVSADRPSETILHVPENPASVKFSLDKKWFAVGCQAGKVRLYDMTAGIPNREFVSLDCGHDSAVQVAFSPDSQLLITSGVYARPQSPHRQIEIWDMADLNAPIHRLSGFEKPTRFPMMGPKNRFVVAPHFYTDTDFHYWDLSTGRDSEPFVLDQHETNMKFIKIDPVDGYLLSGSEDGRVLRWTTGQGKPVAELLLHLDETVWDIQRLEDRWVIVSGSQTQRTLTEITVESREVSATTVDTNDAKNTQLNRAGTAFRVGDNVWSASGELIAAHTHVGSGGHVFSADGSHFSSFGYSLEGYISISNLLEGYTLRVQPQYDRRLFNQGIDFSCDNRWLAFAGFDLSKQVRLWELDIDSLLDRARRLAGRELTDDERKDYGITLNQ